MKYNGKYSHVCIDSHVEKIRSFRKDRIFVCVLYGRDDGRVRYWDRRETDGLKNFRTRNELRTSREMGEQMGNPGRCTEDEYEEMSSMKELALVTIA